MANSKPTIVFAPGAWHTADCFSLVQEALGSQGWSTEGVSYPSVGAEPPTKGLADDAKTLRDALERLCDQGEQIVLVVHSYGGLVGSTAVEGLGYQQRLSRGQPGGIIMFVYLAAFVIPPGKSILDMLGGQFLPWMNVQGNYVYAENPETIFYHDMDSAAQEKAISELKHQSAAIFTDSARYEPWNDMECMYFYCDDDKALPLPVQSRMAGSLGPNAISYHTKASHSPFLSQIEDVVKGVEYAAKVGQERARAGVKL